jgi:hypothetical protein
MIMASPFQQQALQRKLIYIGLIVVLFTVLFLVRQHVDAKATELTWREENIGEVELTGRAVELTLTGSRGLVVSVLWYVAQDMQKKNEWNELELVTRSITKLQPHFITPWLFQSWNLAYNVSVESDRIRDKYYYITRGTALLGEGERKNKNQPIMRNMIGFYQENKFGVADEVNTFRCLYQLSCIPPDKRYAENFRTKDERNKTVVNMSELEKFCGEHPQLIRRLHDQLHMDKPEDIVQFLADNQRVPGIYEDLTPDEIRELQLGRTPPSRLRPVTERFPVLPQPIPLEGEQHPLPEDEIRVDQIEKLTDDFNAYQAARAWYAYSLVAVPEPSDMPGEDKPITEEQRTQFRKPNYTTVLFRQSWPRVQSVEAEQLEKAGWFGDADDPGWDVSFWFPKGGPISKKGLAVQAWGRANDMFHTWANQNHIDETAESLANKEKAAEVYRKKFGLPPGHPGVRLTDEIRNDPQLYEGHLAHRFLFLYVRCRELTNFKSFFYRAQLEAKPETVAARRGLFVAERDRKAGQRNDALVKYEKALAQWAELMKNTPNAADDSVLQDEMYDAQAIYLQLLQDLSGQEIKQILAVPAVLGQAALTPGPAPPWLALVPLAKPRLAPTPGILPPLAGLIKEETIQRNRPGK